MCEMCAACWDINDPKWIPCPRHGRGPCPYCDESVKRGSREHMRQLAEAMPEYPDMES